jgi:hypothetical protein
MAATIDQDRGFTENGFSISEKVPREQSTTDSSQTRSGADEKDERASESPGKEPREPRDTEHQSDEPGPSQDEPPAEPPSEQPLQRVGTAGEDYSVLTSTQKKLIITTASLTSLFSPMATAIYCQFHLQSLNIVI